MAISNNAAKTIGSYFLLAVTCLTLLGGCPMMPDTGVTTLEPANLAELRDYLLKHKPDFDQFRLRGPFAVSVQEAYEIRTSATERIEADLYLSAAAGKAPLVILLHGQDNSKADHAYQALHLATWGMHSLCLNLPNKGPWIRNGRTLARIAKLIHTRPEIIDSRIDPERIILVGHSFGGSSVAIALAEGAPAAGGILLDPAGVGRAVRGYLKKIRTPVMVLASDERVALTRNRVYFYEYISRNVATVSVTNASHEDAQFPLEPAPPDIETDASPMVDLQITYVSALTSAAFSLGLTGKLDYAWSSLDDAIQKGRMFGALRK